MERQGNQGGTTQSGEESMKLRNRLLGGMLLGVLLLAGGPLSAQTAPPAPNVLGNKTLDSLAATFRSLLLRNIPNPLYETNSNWGHTREVANGLKWTGDILPLHPHVTHAEKNSGVWRKLRVTATNPADTLVFDLRNLQQPEPTRKTFEAFLAFDANLNFDEEKWRAGVRTLAFSVRGRLRVRLHLWCEVTSRSETAAGALIPDVIFRLRVTKADLGYDNLVVEHIAGIGGEAAKVMGDTIHGFLRDFRPQMERHLLDRANAAIVQAGDTKEVRLSLSNLFEHKDALADSAIDLLKKKK
jgi:hypothetical protein